MSFGTRASHGNEERLMSAGGFCLPSARNCVWPVLLLLMLASPLIAQENSDSNTSGQNQVDEDDLFGPSGETDSSEGGSGDIDEDDLFSPSGSGDDAEDSLFGDDMIEELPAPGEEDGQGGNEAYLELLSSDQVLIGGTLSSSLSNTWYWSSAYDGDSSLTDADELLDLSLGGAVSISARPYSDLRIFMKAVTEYPFDQNSEIFEFYSDVNWKQKLYFRFGKQTVNWGVGYFYSPADIISLVPIDPEDPEAEREGPVAIKVSYPWDVNGLEFYVIGDESVTALTELGLASRLTLYLQPVELGFGAGYQQDRPFRLIGTARLPLRDWSFFAETRASFGRLEQKITGSGLEDDDNLYFAATAGLSYMKTDMGEGDSDFTLLAQYYFQGEGYADADILTAAATAYAADILAGELDYSELPTYFGQHYSAVSLAIGDLADEHLTLAMLWQANWSDLSGIINPSISVEIFDYLGVSAGLLAAYGPDVSEYQSIFKNPFGDLAVTLTVDLGGGRF